MKIINDLVPRSTHEKHLTVEQALKNSGVSRRSFMKFCAATASLMALPPTASKLIAATLSKIRRPSVIWLSFQECTGCTESLTRSHSPSIESLIFDVISLDYHHTLQAASGDAAEAAREAAMHENKGKYLLVVDGSIPIKDDGVYSTIAGMTNLQMLKETAEHAAAIVAIGSCSAFGGLPNADPNPTGAVPVSDIITDKPIINVPGCPPIPSVIAGVVVQYLTFGLPELDHLNRPKAFYGQSIHDRCYRRPFYERGLFAENFDDEGAKKGWCLFKVGCKGPTTYNACATTKWNNGTSFPIEAGHGCIGCSEPNFWDNGGFYQPLSQIPKNDQTKLGVAVAAGAVAGIGASLVSKVKQKKNRQQISDGESS